MLKTHKNTLNKNKKPFFYSFPVQVVEHNILGTLFLVKFIYKSRKLKTPIYAHLVSPLSFFDAINKYVFFFVLGTY